MAAAPFPVVDLGGAEEVWPDASHSWVSGMSCRRSRALCRASASRGGFGCAFMCRSWLSRLTVARELSCTAALLDRRMARARVRCGGRRLPLSPAARSADCERSAKEVQEQNAALISRSAWLESLPRIISNQAGAFCELAEVRVARPEAAGSAAAAAAGTAAAARPQLRYTWRGQPASRAA